MRQDNLVSSAALSPGDPVLGGLVVQYYLQSSDFEGDVPHKGFGIEARLYEDGRLIDRQAVEDIAVSQDEVLGLIARISAHTVTPIVLQDVVEDYLGT